MENRHREALRRIFQSDQMLADDGRTPEIFQLLHRGGMQSEIHHPRWDPSWAVPDEHTLDDLGELGFLRIEASPNRSRRFVLTMRGRDEARALAAQRNESHGVGGSAPDVSRVLAWIVAAADDEPDILDVPRRLLDRAVNDQFIGGSSRDALARRILGLIEDGYIHGELAGLDQTTAEQELNLAENLQLTMKAVESQLDATDARHQNIITIVNSQVAAGSIVNYVSIREILDTAAQKIDELVDIDDETAAEARTILDQLKGKMTTGASAVMTGAGGALVASVLAQLLGLHG